MPISLRHQFEQMEARAEEAELLAEARKNAPKEEEKSGCKGSYWSSVYQGPCWVCECCTEHGCKDSSKHCHRGHAP